MSFLLIRDQQVRHMDNLLLQGMESLTFLKHSPWILCIISDRSLDWTFNVESDSARARNAESYRFHDGFGSNDMYMADIWPHGEKHETLSLCLYRALIIIINLVVSSYRRWDLISRSPTPRNRVLVEFSCLAYLSFSSSSFSCNVSRAILGSPLIRGYVLRR